MRGQKLEKLLSDHEAQFIIWRICATSDKAVNQWTTVRRWTTPVAAVAAAAAAAMAAMAAMAVVDNEDGIQWWRWGGHSMAAAAFDGDGDGPQIGKRCKDGG